MRELWPSSRAGDCFRGSTCPDSVMSFENSAAAPSGGRTGVEAVSSVGGASVILASSISPSSASAFSEAVPTDWGGPLILNIDPVRIFSYKFGVAWTHDRRGLGWNSGALGFKLSALSFSGRGVDDFADADLTPLVMAVALSVVA